MKKDCKKAKIIQEKKGILLKQLIELSAEADDDIMYEEYSNCYFHLQIFDQTP